MKPLSALIVIALFVCSLAARPAAAQASPHFDSCHERTGNNATLIVPTAAVDLDGAGMEPEDELAIFTPDGVCAGWALWNGSNTALAVWEDNPLTETVDGFVPGEPMRYAIWDASQAVEYGQDIPVEVDYHADFEDDGVFHPDAVYLVSSLAVTMPVGNEPGAPVAFALTGNYPNPFADRTTIGYELPENARVTLEVYDLLGQRVGVLVDETRPAGRHEVQFHAPPDVASGVYVYRLQAGAHTSHRKMTLVN